MFQMLIDPPVSYVFALFIGFVMGVGVELIHVGLLSFSMMKITKKRKSSLMNFLFILTLSFGVAFTIIGFVLFLTLIINVFMLKSHIFSLCIDIILVMITSILLIIPVYLRRRDRNIVNSERGRK